MSDDEAVSSVKRIDITPIVYSRYFILSSSAATVGALIGFARSSRQASLRFLAENAHRPPTTVQGWYYYNKTKNYRWMLGGLKGAGVDALKLATTALGWAAIEDGLQRVGWGSVSEAGAAIGTAGVFSAMYRLPYKATSRTILLGAMIGGGMRFLRWAKEYLRQEMSTRAAAAELESDETQPSGGPSAT